MGKQRRGGRATTMASWLYNAAKEHGDDTQQLSHASAKLKVTTGAPGSRWKLADGEVSPAGTVPTNYRIVIRLISQITPMVTQKSPKIKIVLNSKFYNFALITILKLCLHFEMQV